MNKYASQFNELIVLAEKEKSKKKGGSMAAIFKLIQDLAQFEENIQEAVNAQEMTENKAQLESFFADLDKMYKTLFGIGEAAIQSMRTERANPLPEAVEGAPESAPAPAPDLAQPVPEVEKSTSFSASDLKKEMDKKPSVTAPLTVPKAPSK